MVRVVALALAAVFGVAAVAKLTDRGGLRRAIADFGLPARITASAGRLLITCEFATALALAVRPWARGGALAALGLLMVFSTAIAVNVSRGRTPACHCFGGLQAAAVGWSALARNGLLAALAGWVAADGHFAGLFAIAAVAASAAWAALAGGSRQARPAGLRTKSSRKVRPGRPAPGFSLRDEEGRTWTPKRLLTGRRPLLLVFSDHACGACSALLPEVARWQDRHGDRLTIAVVSGGPRPKTPSARTARGHNASWQTRTGQYSRLTELRPHPAPSSSTPRQSSWPRPRPARRRSANCSSRR